MVPGESSALASVTVPLLLSAISWGLLTAEDQAFSNLNRHSCEDKLREIVEVSKLLALYQWSAAVLLAALWHVVASRILECSRVFVVLWCVLACAEKAGSRTCIGGSVSQPQSLADHGVVLGYLTASEARRYPWR